MVLKNYSYSPQKHSTVIHKKLVLKLINPLLFYPDLYNDHEINFFYASPSIDWEQKVFGCPFVCASVHLFVSLFAKTFTLAISFDW